MAVGHFFPSNGGGYGGRETSARQPSGYVQAVLLTANTAATITPPAGANLVVFKATGDFFAAPDVDPTVPAGAVEDGTAPELNPAIWSLEGVTTIRVISAGTPIITAAFYT